MEIIMCKPLTGHIAELCACTTPLTRLDFSLSLSLFQHASVGQGSRPTVYYHRCRWRSLLRVKTVRYTESQSMYGVSSHRSSVSARGITIQMNKKANELRSEAHEPEAEWTVSDTHETMNMAQVRPSWQKFTNLLHFDRKPLFGNTFFVSQKKQPLNLFFPDLCKYRRRKVRLKLQTMPVRFF